MRPAFSRSGKQRTGFFRPITAEVGGDECPLHQIALGATAADAHRLGHGLLEVSNRLVPVACRKRGETVDDPRHDVSGCVFVVRNALANLTEQPVEDFTHEMLVRATQDDIWEVFMVAFHMMHQSARKELFPLTRQKRIGTLLMFAVRSIFAKPERVVAALRDAAAAGKVDKSLGESAEPLGFLIHDSGAGNITEAAYRFARHEPGVDVVLFGTGDAGHLRANVASLLRPPLPEADRAKLVTLFGQLTGVGMDSAPMQIK